MIIDIEGNCDIKRIINIYICFNPVGDVSPRDKFKTQLNLIKQAMIPKTVLLGDFNLDYGRIYDDNYAHKNLFADFDEILSDYNLIQMVNFVTWSRMIGPNLRSSVLDHVYVKDPVTIRNLGFIRPHFGDHLLVEFCVKGSKNKPKVELRRDWRRYSGDLLNTKLNGVDWEIDIDEVQEYWNVFESKLIRIVDEIVPLAEFSSNTIVEKPDKVVKNKINRRNRLLKQFQTRPSVDLKSRIANLNYEIKSHFFAKNRQKVRKGIIPGNCKTLWRSVKLAKNQGMNSIPPNMSFDQKEVAENEISDCFAEFFDKKVRGIVESVKVDAGVYNGRQKILANDCMFMSGDKIIECIKSLKMKNTEGYDRIPQRIIIDGQESLSKPLEKLFSLIYR